MVLVDRQIPVMVLMALMVLLERVEHQEMMEIQEIAVTTEVMEVQVTQDLMEVQVSLVTLTSPCHQVSGVGHHTNGNELLVLALNNKV